MTKFEDSFSEEVWRTTYKHHEDTNVEDTFHRVAKAIASVEKTEALRTEWEDKFFDMLSNFKVTTGGRIYSNAGTDFGNTTLANCLSGNTLVHTDKGMFPIADLAGTVVNVLNGNGVYSPALFSQHGEQEVFEVQFSNGEVVEATANHRWVVNAPKGGKSVVTTEELVGKSVALVGLESLCVEDDSAFREGIKNGLILGDGNLYYCNKHKATYSRLNQFYDSRHLVADNFGWCKTGWYKDDPEGVYWVDGQPARYKDFPVINEKSVSYLLGFLAGLLASDGCVDTRGHTMIHTADYEYACLVQELCATVGIPVPSVKKVREVSPFDGKKSDLWKIVLSKKYVKDFLVLKNSHTSKRGALVDKKALQGSVRCLSVSSIGRLCNVFCCEENVTHSFVITNSLLLTGNCFVGPNVPHDMDSLKGIMQHLDWQAKTLASEGGWGENFSYIRPRGAFIEGIGVETPGAVKFMEMFDKSSEIVTSGSGKKSKNSKAKGKIRKGAMMGCLDCWHPDVIEFITAKQQHGRLTKFNISVNFSDEFMGRLLALNDPLTPPDRQNELDQWELIFPDTKHPAYKAEWVGNIQEWKAKGYPVVVHDTVSVRQLWNLVMESTYNRAEPGVLFLDRANYFNPFSYGETIKATNPCFRGDMRLLTTEGYKRIDSLEGREFNNVNKDGTVSKGKVWSNGVKSTVEVRFAKKDSIFCTPDHRFMLNDESECEAKNLKGKRLMPFYSIKSVPVDEESFKAGFIFGDGMLNRLNSERHLGMEVCIGKKDLEVAPYFGVTTAGNHYLTSVYDLAVKYGLKGALTYDRVLPDEVNEDFMMGLYSANGSVIKSASRVALKATSRALVDKVATWLASNGMTPYITTNKPTKVKFANGDYLCKQSYDVNLVGNENLIIFAEKVSFLHEYKRKALEVAILNSAPYVQNVVESEAWEVFDFNEPVAHWGVLQGVVVHNCGEQTLAPGGICCLGSVNLTQFLDDKTREVDINGITKYVKYLVRFLDNVNEYSGAPLPEYTDSMRNKRRIGCGVLGWGSLLFMKKVVFGSEEALELQEQIMQAYARAAYEASIDLAMEKGKFKYCVPERHAQGAFINSIGLSDGYMEKLKHFGIRNSSLLSQQPTGNTSILANIVSGGIEPIFMPEYIRTVIVPQMPEDMQAFTPKWFEGEWFETEVFKETKEGDEPILKGVWNGVTYKIDKSRGLTKEVLCEDYGVRWLKARGEWAPTATWAVTTTQLSAQAHITDLKGFARYTDSACSKTVNIPNDYPYEEFKNLYLDVYKTGYIKGFTTYRSGTMSAVLAAKEDTESEGEEVILDDVKLSDSLPAVMKRLKAEGKKWYVTTIMNEDSTAPMALFVHTNHPEKNTTSKYAAEVLFALARLKGVPEQYVKEIEDKVVADNNTTKIARAISLNLRHGVRVRSIVSALDAVDNIFVGSFLFTIKKYLSSFIKNGEKVAGVKCSECGSDKIVYEEGCQKCVNCGSSKCG